MIYAPGFSNPVLNSQTVYRSLMSAMAEPAKVICMEKYCQGPAGLFPTTAAIALTLFDNDTVIFNADNTASSNEWIRFHCGAPLTVHEPDAHYAIIPKNHAPINTSLLSIGSPEYPDKSATLLIEVESFNEGMALEATGPGIKESTRFRVTGLAPQWLQLMADNTGLFPQGIDYILLSPESLLCLPRTTRLRSPQCM